MTPAEYNAMECATQSKLMAINLATINALPRRALLRFLDLEHSKANTSRLRVKARRIAIRQDAIDVSLDLDRAAR
jgi:hypothetical protein